MTLIAPQRHLFDIPDDVAYFNVATNSPMLLRARDALNDGVNSKCHPWNRTADDFFDDAEKIRILASNLFGGSPEGYAIVPAASYGVSTAARAIEPTLKEGDQILLIAEEFPSNVLPWRRTASVTNSKIITVDKPDSGGWTEAIVGAICKDTKVVSLSTCHWTNGAYIDLLSIRNACDKVGASLVLDATQTLGAMPLSMDEVRPDFLVAAGYKWLLSPYGFGILYVAEKWRDARPLEETWLARDNAHNFSELVTYSDNYLSGARRFDMGEKCIPTILPGAIAGLEQLSLWGIDNIAATLTAINEDIIDQLQGLGFTVPAREYRCPHMFGAELPANYEKNLLTELSSQNIYVSQRGSAIRFAPHLHINDGDISKLKEALQQIFG